MLDAAPAVRAAHSKFDAAVKQAEAQMRTLIPQVAFATVHEAWQAIDLAHAVGTVVG